MKNGTVAFIGNFNIEQMNAAGKRIRGLADAISDEYEIVFIGWNNQNKFTKLKRTDEGEYIAHYPLPKNIVDRLSVKKYYLFVCELLETISDLKCIISYGTPVMASFVGRMQKWAKKRNIIFISDVVDMIYRNGKGGIGDFVKYRDTKKLKEKIILDSNGIIAISSKIKEIYNSFGCENVIVVPPITKKNYKNNMVKKGTSQSIKIVYAGVPFNQVKNISTHQMKDRLDWAIEQLISVSKNSAINLSFDIYGITKEDYLYSIPKHKDLIKNNNIVRFHGKVTHDVIEECIKNADFTIICREKNLVTDAGFPTKFTESMCLGTPVITTDTSDLDRYILEGKNAVKIDYGFKNSNIEKLTQLFLDRKKISEMKQYTNDHYCFDPRLYSEDIINLIKNVQMR